MKTVAGQRVQGHKRRSPPADAQVSELHPRNRHQGRYDFHQLKLASPGLGEFIGATAHGELGIDFSNPAAVKELNRALLASHYGIYGWDIPLDSLCPSVPGRADYIHYLADLLARCNHGVVPKTKCVRVLDIGTGASCIYPLMAYSEYGWQSVATDISAASLANAQDILDANPQVKRHVELRQQKSSASIFSGILGEDDWFDLTLCNPPFHASATEAREGTQRKWRNLGKSDDHRLNFGGQDAELWCPGGEAGFIHRMIAESEQIPTRCFWFTSLVSKSANLPALYEALRLAKVAAHQTIEMRAGQKTSRFVAWTFLTPIQQAAWRKLRW